MSRVTDRVCDRCRGTVGHGGDLRLGISVTVNYHHPKTLDLCVDCEGELTIWLGRHPLWGTPLDQILAGGASGEGYPSRERIAILRRDRGLPPWCPTCMREGRMPPGELDHVSDGQTEVYTCGHASGK